MYKKLNKKQIKRFAQRYLPDWVNDIYEVSLLKYARVKEYLVNEHYFVVVYKDKVVEKDLQEYNIWQIIILVYNRYHISKNGC